MDTIGDQMLNREIITRFRGGPLDGARRAMRLAVALPAASARAIEIFTRHPESGEPIDPAPYQIRVPPIFPDDGISVAPDEEDEEVRAVWVYAGPVETVL